jgi:hypothetical protein
MAITTRSGKGSPLTHGELDTNFTDLDTRAGDNDTRLTTLETQTLDARITVIEDSGWGAQIMLLENQNADARLDVLESQTLDARLDVIEGQTLDTRLTDVENNIIGNTFTDGGTSYAYVDNGTDISISNFNDVVPVRSSVVLPKNQSGSGGTWTYNLTPWSNPAIIGSTKLYIQPDSSWTAGDKIKISFASLNTMSGPNIPSFLADIFGTDELEWTVTNSSFPSRPFDFIAIDIYFDGQNFWVINLSK